MLTPTDNVAVASLSDLKDGVYTIELSEERSICGPLDGPEYLGFNNRTCSTKIDPRTTAGPVMRGPSDSMMWREWTIRVVHQRVEKEDYKTVSLQAFIHPDVEQDARCLGFLSTFYDSPGFKATCAIPPYGNALFLNSSRDDSEDNSEMWKIRQSDGATGEFEIVASNKPDVCLGILAVEDCSNQLALIENSPPYLTQSRKWRSWRLMKRYDLVRSSPPPPPSPVPPSPLPPPPGPAPGPVISAPSSTTSEYVTVRVESIGGDGRCSVSSVALTSIGSSIGSIPQTVEVSATTQGLSSVGVAVPLSPTGYNSVYAVGKCNNGGTTERSNGLSVFYMAPDEGLQPTPMLYAASIVLESLGAIYACNIGTNPDRTFIGQCYETATVTRNASPNPLGIDVQGTKAYFTYVGGSISGIHTCDIVERGTKLSNCVDAVEHTDKNIFYGIQIQGDNAYIAYDTTAVLLCKILPNGSFVDCATTGDSMKKLSSILVQGNRLYRVGNVITVCSILNDGKLSGCTLAYAYPETSKQPDIIPHDVAIRGTKAYVTIPREGIVLLCSVQLDGTLSDCSPTGDGFSNPFSMVFVDDVAYISDRDSGVIYICDTLESGDLSNCQQNSVFTSNGIPDLAVGYWV